jgi:predicted GNAT family acetyltransferase
MGNKNDNTGSTLRGWSEAIDLMAEESATKTARGQKVRKALEEQAPLTEAAKEMMRLVFDHHSVMESVRWRGVAEGVEEAVLQRLTRQRTTLNEMADLVAPILSSNTDAE